MKNLLKALCIAFLLVLATASPADTIYVNPGENIQDAIG